MEQYVIKGGNVLEGEVEISGAKNAALAILAASIMTDDTVHLENVPDVRDVAVMIDAMAAIGVYVKREGDKLTVNASNIHHLSVDYEYIKKIRASYYLLGALLGKYHRAEVALPGGCDIGSRPIDLHIKGFQAIGAKTDISYGLITADADELVGNHIYMDKVSVGATINVMMASCLAYGKTTIENAAKEPHVVDTANFLNSMGADIRGAGTDVIRIRGVERLRGTEYSVVPDQIEAGTFMCLAAATGGDITVKNIIPKHMEAASAKLSEIGCTITEYDDSIRVNARDRVLKTASITTLPYPGFPTDLQPQIAVVLGLCDGTGTVTESIWGNRFRYVSELIRMGASIQVEGNIAVIKGVKEYQGAHICAPDLRAGAALVIAALAAKDGITTIDDIYYIKRGYQDFEKKLAKLGGNIKQVSSENERQKFILLVS